MARGRGIAFEQQRANAAALKLKCGGKADRPPTRYDDWNIHGASSPSRSLPSGEQG
ncbi:hypothetical protein SFOMI_4417 [Sphingobium fuliginis]|uniref:Uncharacterized protein n=1 Tax=Sphingobium fuliginis (strain ATCC 27551) TaxID=336203 RepID=A0A292ZLU0_SPHSA|nr:hypothetical protein SFOMI_4417 [Sphingobium fuliginis]